MGKCKGLLTRIGNVMGKDKHAFWMTINPKLVPDYYNIIKDPIFLGQIEEKLRGRQYKSPLEFHADVTKFFNNCFMYNPIGDYFRVLSEKASADYEAAWNATGFSGMNPTSFQGGGIDTGPGKRSKAGQARPKFLPDADTFDAMPKPKPGFKGSNPKVRKEVPISETRKREMGEQMQSEAMEPYMEQFMNLLPPSLLEGADGEFELDFEALDDPTLRKIDVFLRGIFGPPVGIAAAAATDLLGSDELEEMLDEEDDMSLSVELDDESEDD